MNLGEIIGAALTKRAAPDGLLVSAVTDLIATQYGFHPEEVSATVWAIAADLHDKGGSICRTLETRHGFATLGLMVAQRLLGDDAADTPLISLPLH